MEHEVKPACLARTSCLSYSWLRRGHPSNVRVDIGAFYHPMDRVKRRVLIFRIINLAATAACRWRRYQGGNKATR